MNYEGDGGNEDTGIIAPEVLQTVIKYMDQVYTATKYLEKSSAQQVLTGIKRLSEEIEKSMVPYRTFATLGKTLEDISKQISHINLKTVSNQIMMAQSILDQAQFKTLSSVVEEMKKLNSFELASVFSSIPQGYVDDSEQQNVANSIYWEDVSKEVAHEVVEKDARKIKEQENIEIPYNMFSNDFIYNRYLPAIALGDLLNSTDEYDSVFVVRFIFFYLLPFIYYLVTQNKPNAIVFEDDEK